MENINLCLLCGEQWEDAFLTNLLEINKFDICPLCARAKYLDWVDIFKNRHMAIYFACYIFDRIYAPEIVDAVTKKQSGCAVSVNKYLTKMGNMKQYRNKSFINSNTPWLEELTHILAGEPNKPGLSSTPKASDVSDKAFFDILDEYTQSFGEFIQKCIDENRSKV